MHGLKFRPIDVQRSEWACTLEPLLRRPPLRVADAEIDAPRDLRPLPTPGAYVVRLGFCYAKGLRQSTPATSYAKERAPASARWRTSSAACRRLAKRIGAAGGNRSAQQLGTGRGREPPLGPVDCGTRLPAGGPPARGRRAPSAQPVTPIAHPACPSARRCPCRSLPCVRWNGWRLTFRVRD